MSATSLGLGGNPVKFLGAYVKSVSSNLGLSVNPSSCTVTLVEDPDFGVFFEPPVMGSYHTLSVGDNWRFAGVIIRYERDIANISGRTIRVTLNDPRQVMKSVPCILAPGAEAIAERMRDTGCSVIDVYGAFQATDQGLKLDLSGYNTAGMTYDRILTALNGGNVRFGEFLHSVPQQTATVFGETYRFDLTEVADVVNFEHRVNTNLVTLSAIIEDLSTKHSFDWFIDSSVADDGIINVVVRTIDRSQDSVALGLQEFLDAHPERIISATSGIELRNELSCLALQGAHVENLKKVDIFGLANEPIDLVPEGGTNTYFMTESEMRLVLAGRTPWEIWLGMPETMGGGGGASRYGGSIKDDWAQPIVQAAALYNMFDANKNLPKYDPRNQAYLASENYNAIGKIFEKLKAHADAVYGKRWVHATILDEVIESAWTRGAATSAGIEDPNEFFRQDDGRTRAYVEFSNESSIGSFSINNSKQLFGDLDLFRNVTVFGNTFSNVSNAEQAVLVCELADVSIDFSPDNLSIDTDKSNYTYNSPEFFGVGTIRNKLWVAGTVEKDGVIKIDTPILESAPDPYELLMAVLAAGSAVKKAVQKNKEKLTKPIIAELQQALAQQAQALANLGLGVGRAAYPNGAVQYATSTRKIQDLQGKLAAIIEIADNSADGTISSTKKKYEQLQRYIGTAYFKMLGRCLQPRFAYIPTRSRTLRYGPVFSKDLGENSQGKVEIQQDDGYSPWEFGGISNMIAAMQLKVDNASSTMRDVFSANISVGGFPQFNLGDALELNGNINSISISFGDVVKTNYSLQTFTRKFGEFSKEDFARLALYGTNSASRVFPQNIVGSNERDRFGVNKNFGRGGGGTNTRPGGAKSFG